jgi:organic radical activating enzyme
MTKHRFSKIEFYITNVCNLNCENCNRFNNYSFNGWQRWADYESVYEKWSQYIDIDHIVLLGGEPLLNPNILDWVRGLNKIFKKKVQILSNGTRINYVKGLYESLRVNSSWMGISWHNPNTLDEFESEIKKFLKGDVVKLEPNLTNWKDAHVVWKDSNQVKIPVWLQYEFNQSAVRPSVNGGFILHNSDPVKSHSVCGFVIEKNYHFIKGKLYKCGPVALFPEFDQQHQFEILDSDRELLNSYQPLTVENIVEHGKEYFKTLDEPLAQCKFCPETVGTVSKLFAVTKNQAQTN